MAIHEVKQCYQNWIKALLQEGNKVEALLALYKEDAVLLPTLSGKICCNKADKQAYFEHFSNLGIYQVHTQAQHISISGNIAVNAVAPGPVGTALFFEGKSEEQIQTIANLAPFERLGQPEEIADVVSFLAGPQGRWINGQILRANGGMV